MERIAVFLVVLLGRLFLKKRSYGSFKIPSIKFGNLSSAVIKAFQGQTRIFLKIALSYFCMTFLVFYLTDEGFFQAFDVIALADSFGLPVETIVPLTSYVASSVLGISLLGPMIYRALRYFMWVIGWFFVSVSPRLCGLISKLLKIKPSATEQNHRDTEAQR